jgi:hypothetical protein
MGDPRYNDWLIHEFTRDLEKTLYCYEDIVWQDIYEDIYGYVIDPDDGHEYRIHRRNRFFNRINSLDSWQAYNYYVQRQRDNKDRTLDELWKPTDQQLHNCMRCMKPYRQHVWHECQECGLQSCIYCIGRHGKYHTCIDRDDNVHDGTHNNWRVKSLKDLETGNTLLTLWEDGDDDDNDDADHEEDILAHTRDAWNSSFLKDLLPDLLLTVPYQPCEMELAEDEVMDSGLRCFLDYLELPCVSTK